MNEALIRALKWAISYNESYEVLSEEEIEAMRNALKDLRAKTGGDSE